MGVVSVFPFHSGQGSDCGQNVKLFLQQSILLFLQFVPLQRRFSPLSVCLLVCKQGYVKTTGWNTTVVCIRGRIQGCFSLSFTLRGRAFSPIFVYFSENNSWILMKESSWYLWVWAIGCRSKSRSSEFKCGFINGLLGHGGGMCYSSIPSLDTERLLCSIRETRELLTGLDTSQGSLSISLRYFPLSKLTEDELKCLY